MITNGDVPYRYGEEKSASFSLIRRRATPLVLLSTPIDTAWFASSETADAAIKRLHGLSNAIGRRARACITIP